jgi:hypothetical protein
MRTPAASMLGAALAVLLSSTPAHALPAAAAQGERPTAAAKPPQTPPIDINSASLARLKTLPYIGDAEARRIVAGRPYPSKASLVADGVLPAGVYQSIRHRIVAVQHQMPARADSAARRIPG